MLSNTVINRFFRQSIMSFKALFGWLDPKLYVVIKLINPIMEICFYILLAGYVYKTKDLTPWIIGKSFLLCTSNTIFGIGSVLREERFSGTLKAVIAAPANKLLVFLGRGFMHIVDASLSVVIGLFIGYLLFGMRLSNINFLSFTLTIIIAMFSASGLGLLISSFGLISRDMNLLMNTVSMCIFGLSGAIFPIDRLPIILQKLSLCIPITRSIKAARLITNGGSSNVIYSLLFQELMVGFAYALAGYLLLRILEEIARKRATLDIY